MKSDSGFKPVNWVTWPSARRAPAQGPEAQPPEIGPAKQLEQTDVRPVTQPARIVTPKNRRSSR